MPPTDYNAATQTHVRRFAGKLTSAQCGELAAIVDAEVQTILRDTPDASLVFDLTDVEYVVSAFLRICLSAAKQLPHGRFAIANCQPEVRKILAIARFDTLFPVS